MVEVLDVSSSPCSPWASTLRGYGFEYDVFLSFRGPDTRKRFAGHLYDALEVRGVKTFIDSEKLEKGQKVEELFGYIQRSKEENNRKKRTIDTEEVSQWADALRQIGEISGYNLADTEG